MESIKEIQPLLERFMKVIAQQFGENCEVVVHDLTQGLEHSVIAIENGYVTGRKVGSPSTNLGLEVLRGTQKGADRYGYITHTPNGKILRSSSIYFENDEGKIIGSFCVNFDITDLLRTQNFLKNLTVSNDASYTQEHFMPDLNDIVEILIHEYLSSHDLKLETMGKTEKFNLIKYLDDKGAFLVRNSSNKVCEFLDISKYTLYAYLKDIQGKSADKVESD